METYRFYKTRAELALDLASRAENFKVREQYLRLAKDWLAKAESASDSPTAH
jgi:hypothetical protein